MATLSDVVTLVAHERATLVVIWWQELWVVPWALNTISNQIQLLENEEKDDEDVHAHANLILVFHKCGNVVEAQVRQADDDAEDAHDIPFTSPLTPLSTLEVLRNDDGAKFVLLEAEDGHTILKGEHRTSRAHNVYEECHKEPSVLVQQNRIHFLDECREDCHESHDDEVLVNDVGEGVLDLHVCAQVIVHKVNLHTCVVHLVATNEPRVLLGVE